MSQTSHSAEATESVVDPTVPSLRETISPEQLQAKLTSLSNSVELNQETRTNVLQLYRQAQERLLVAQEYSQRAMTFARDATNVARQLEEVRSRAEPATTTEGPTTNATLAELERALVGLEVRLQTVNEEKAQLDEEPSRRARRARELAQAGALARNDLEAVERELRNAPVPGTPEVLRQAKRDRALATQAWRRAELELYDAELAFYNGSADLLLRQIAAAAEHRAVLQGMAQQTQQSLTRRRQEASARAQSQAKREFAEAEGTQEPFVIAIATTNRELAQQRVVLADMSAIAAAELERSREELVALDEDFRRVRTRVEAAELAGLTRSSALGFVLRQAQTSAPSIRDYVRAIDARREQISTTQLKQFELREERRNLLHLEPQLAAVEAELPSNLSPPQREATLRQTRSMLETQRTLIDDLYGTCEDYGAALLRLNSVDVELERKATEYRSYLQQMVLWVRSNEVLNLASARQELASLRRLVRSPEGPAAWVGMERDFRANALLYVGFALLLGLLWLRLRSWDRSLAGTRREIERRIGLAFRPTAEASGLAMGSPALLAGGLAFLGWRMRLALVGNAMGERAGDVLLASSVVAFMLLFYRNMCRPGGLAEVHFGWLPQDAARTRRGVTAIAWVVLPFSCVSGLIDSAVAQGVSNRLLFIPTLFFWVALGHYLLRPHAGLVLRVQPDGHPQPPGFWRWLAYLFVVGFPLALALASAAGFNYTARRIWLAFAESVLLVLAYIPLRALLLRWMAVLRRRLALDQARKRREVRSEKMESMDDAPVDAAALISEAEEEELTRSLAEYDRLLRSVFGVILALALWGIWADVRSAVQQVTAVPLWRRESPIAAPSPPGGKSALPGLGAVATDSSPAAAAGEGARGVDGNLAGTPVTVGDLLYALIATGLTVTLVRNLPGFVQMVVLKRVRLAPGTGYALTTVLRYVLVLIGVLSVSAKIGLSWNKVQWLAAAVTLGIGFGLQEIFANFVSGLILLFERPVRVGDVVTVGEVTGIVMRIRMRATTIKDWDGKELVLPNKDLVTGRFVNWTLSDSITRLTLPIGIAYEADVNRARNLLLEIAQNNPKVLRDPPASVVFEGFGASTLNLILRVFVDGVAERAGVLTELNAAINTRFRQEGIEIAFPQQDLHIRSLPPGLRPAGEPEAGAMQLPPGPTGSACANSVPDP